MQDTAWAYSNEIDGTDIRPEEGPQYIVIENAMFDDAKGTYVLNLRSLGNEAQFRITYWMNRLREDGTEEPSSSTRRTLISLKRALYGPDAIGIPNPVDITGCVVLAEVKMKAPNAKGISYPAIYSYGPVPKDVAVSWGREDQYSTE